MTNTPTAPTRRRTGRRSRTIACALAALGATSCAGFASWSQAIEERDLGSVSPAVAAWVAGRVCLDAFSGADPTPTARSIPVQVDRDVVSIVVAGSPRDGWTCVATGRLAAPTFVSDGSAPLTAGRLTPLYDGTVLEPLRGDATGRFTIAVQVEDSTTKLRIVDETGSRAGSAVSARIHRALDAVVALHAARGCADSSAGQTVETVVRDALPGATADAPPIVVAALWAELAGALAAAGSADAALAAYQRAADVDGHDLAHRGAVAAARARDALPSPLAHLRLQHTARRGPARFVTSPDAPSTPRAPAARSRDALAAGDLHAAARWAERNHVDHAEDSASLALLAAVARRRGDPRRAFEFGLLQSVDVARGLELAPDLVLQLVLDADAAGNAVGALRLLARHWPTDERIGTDRVDLARFTHALEHVRGTLDDDLARRVWAAELAAVDSHAEAATPRGDLLGDDGYAHAPGVAPMR